MRKHRRRRITAVVIAMAMWTSAVWFLDFSVANSSFHNAGDWKVELNIRRRGEWIVGCPWLLVVVYDGGRHGAVQLLVWWRIRDGDAGDFTIINSQW